MLTSALSQMLLCFWRKDRLKLRITLHGDIDDDLRMSHESLQRLV